MSCNDPPPFPAASCRRQLPSSRTSPPPSVCPAPPVPRGGAPWPAEREEAAALLARRDVDRRVLPAPALRVGRGDEDLPLVGFWSGVRVAFFCSLRARFFFHNREGGLHSKGGTAEDPMAPQQLQTTLLQASRKPSRGTHARAHTQGGFATWYGVPRLRPVTVSEYASRLRGLSARGCGWPASRT